MNDNIRYISLQYIKGNNYDKVTCFIFNSEKFNTFFETNKNKTNKELFNSLEKTKKSKCNIGESLLDDLINYIEFKELIPLLEKSISYAEEKQLKTKTEKPENTSDDTELNKELKNLFSKLKNIVNKIQNKKDGNSDDIEIFKNVVNDLINKFSYNNANIYENLEEVNNSNYDKKKYQNTILKTIKNELEKIEEGTIQRKMLTAKNIFKYFNLIYELLLDDIKGKKEFKKRENDDYDKLIKLYNKYIYICNSNIKKYEKIFEYNEIDNIDDAFMIVSYSKFLKKLRKIKESLESKDTDKIKRNLIHFIDRFYNLHGFNPENIKDDADISYLVERILKYT
jgi:hypothetical protein